jgi:hypothetical protein
MAEGGGSSWQTANRVSVIMADMKATLFRWFRRTPSRDTTATTHELLPQIRPIPNADLTEADLPLDDADWDHWPGIAWFAASFNGYQYWGSFEKCFEVGHRERTQPLKRLTLTELRTALFCRYRAICHDGEPTTDDVSWARAVITEIRDRIRRRAVD